MPILLRWISSFGSRHGNDFQTTHYNKEKRVFQYAQPTQTATWNEIENRLRHGMVRKTRFSDWENAVLLPYLRVSQVDVAGGQGCEARPEPQSI